jgi:hypothetical protein
MASRAFTRVNASYASPKVWRPVEPLPDPLSELARRSPSTFSEESDGIYVSSRAALGGAKAAMIAIGVEAAVVLFPVAVWQIWRLFR